MNIGSLYIPGYHGIRYTDQTSLELTEKHPDLGAGIKGVNYHACGQTNNPPQKKNKAKETKNKKQSKDLYYVFVLCIWRHQETLPGEGVMNRVLVCALRDGC